MGYEEKGPQWVLGRGEDSCLGKNWDYQREEGGRKLQLWRIRLQRAGRKSTKTTKV